MFTKIVMWYGDLTFMRMKKNILSTILVFTMSAALLTGCTTPKKAIRETATEFLEIVKNGSTENIEQYASPEVLESEFVHTFDSSFLTDNLKSAIDAEMLNEETAQRLDNLCASLSNMITSYELTSVSMKKRVGTVVATVNTAFPLNIIGSEDASSRISVKVEAYNEANPDKVNNSDPEIAKQAYNDMINLVLETYEDMMEESSEESYVFVFTLARDAETKKWRITSVKDYESAANGVVITTTDTDGNNSEDAETEETETEETESEETAQEENSEDTESEDAGAEEGEAETEQAE